ncbi:hypothetical protein F5B19DRAFT_461510 [Rostrohypoxylon terebratum]|nr:hypothetical protein F5B19DRAFT_461510 [Rostrohypoxylon terebratum]
MRLCKALRNSRANFGQRATIAPYFHRRYFADDHQPQQDSDHEHKRDAETETEPEPETGSVTPPTRRRNNIAHPAIDWDNAFKVNPENKTVETAAGDLPLSPIMDPTYWEATRRHHVPKAKPGKPQNSVERQLRANPFAKALATPVRNCCMTRVRLPSFFLQNFNVVSHPESGNPWLIPVSLMPDEAPAKEEPSAEKILEIQSEENAQEREEESENIESKPGYLQEDRTSTTSSGNERIAGPSIYILGRQDLVSAFADKKSSFSGGPKRMLGSTPRYRNLTRNTVWRTDMDTYILDLMRKSIVSELLYLSGLCAEQGRHYIVKCYGWGDVQYKHKGSVIWFENPVEDVGSNQTDNQPGPFAVFDIQRTSFQGGQYTESVAVHNMPMLLGLDVANRLKEEAKALTDGSIFMLAGRRTVNIQMKLWKLQGYLSDYRD